jgi:MFS family permease
VKPAERSTNARIAGLDGYPALGLWSPQLRATTAGLVMAVTLVAFEALAVITILPVISGDLGGINLYGWVISAFSLGTVFGIVAAGDQVDRRGPAPPFIGGLLLFSLGLLAGGLAPTMLVLVIARAVQGIGAGAIPSVAYASIGRSYDDAVRPRMLAVLSTAWVVPGLAGPSLAALVAAHAGWRWVFLGLLPLVAVSGTIALGPLHRLGPPVQRRAAPFGRIADAARVSAGVGLLLGALNSRSAVVAPPLILAAAAVAVRPLLRLIPVGTFRASSGLPAAVLSRGLLTFAFFGADTYVPLSLTSVRGQTPTFAAVAITAATLSWTTGAWIQARQAPIWSAARLVRTGFAVILLGIAMVAAVLIPDVPVVVAIAGWLVAGLGIGIAYGSITLAVMRAAPPGQEGSSAAAMQLFDNLGVALGAGLGGVAVAVGAAAGWAPRTGVAIAFAVATVAGLAGVAVSRRLPAVVRG